MRRRSRVCYELRETIAFIPRAKRIAMSTPVVPDAGSGPKKHVPFVPEHLEMKEFTLRAILLGLFMTVVLGAANAYLGLREIGRAHV